MQIKHPSSLINTPVTSQEFIDFNETRNLFREQDVVSFKSSLVTKFFQAFSN